MSDHLLHPDDPRLTAYALGELSPTENAEVERLLADAPDCRAAVEEIRSLAGQLTAELQSEPVAALSDSQRTAIVGAVQSAPAVSGASLSQGIRWTRHLAAFGTLAAMGAVAMLMLPPQRPGDVPVRLTGKAFNDAEIVLLEEERANPELVAAKETFGSDFDKSREAAESMPQRANFGRGGQSSGKWKDNAYGNDRLGDEHSVAANGSAVTGPATVSQATDRRTKLADSISHDTSGPVVAEPRPQAGAPVANTPLTAVANSRKTAIQAGDDPPLRMTRPAGTTRLEYNTSKKNRSSEAGAAEAAPRTAAPGYVISGQQAQRLPEIRSKSTAESLGKRPIADSKESLSEADRHSVEATPSNSQKSPVPEQRMAGRGVVVLRGNETDVDEVKKIIRDVELGNRFVTAGGAGGGDQDAKLSKKVAQYNSLVSQNRFDEAAAVANETKQLAPKNPVAYEMELKAQLAKRDYYHRQSDEKGQSRGWLYQLDELDAGATHFTQDIQYPDREKLRLWTERRKELAARESARELDESLARVPRSSPTPGTEQYEPIYENAYVSPREQPLSTFSVDVDTASYANMRRFLNQGQWPPANAVRIEELVNYFSYDYPQPNSDRPFSVNVETGACPWQPEHRLVRIGLKGKEIARDKRPAGNLVFLVDVSGSMVDQKKLPLVKEGLNLLAEQMTESDRIAIVTYSDTAAVKLDSTVGSDQQTIRGVINSLHAAGSTNGAAGIQMAYDMAVRHFIDGGTNRVILCTDGDFNVGVTGDDELVKLIQERARTKVYFSVFGFGMGNLKDGKLEKLADKGNGHYAYIDDQNELRKVFVEELSGTLITIAKDVKIQVEFNPAIVGAYRQIGYENRALAAQDFADDKKDAGEIGAGHSVTALYEIVPTERVVATAPRGESLRYQAVLVPKDGEAAAELLTVRLRYKQPDAATPRDVAFLPLTQLDAEDTAKKLRELYGEKREQVPTFEADAKQRRLIVRGQPETVEQVRLVLRSLGEETDASILYEMHVKDTPPASSRPSPDFNWAAAVAGFGMVLRGSHYRGQAGLDIVLELAQGAKGEDKTGRRQEFISLVERAKALRPEMSSAVHRSAGATPVEPPATTATPLSREEAQQKATVNGKYRNLLRVIEAPGDANSYGAFRDWGHYTGTSYLEHKNLPQGYWVYVAPHWYIWGDKQ